MDITDCPPGSRKAARGRPEPRPPLSKERMPRWAAAVGESCRLARPAQEGDSGRRGSVHVVLAVAVQILMAAYPDIELGGSQAWMPFSRGVARQDGVEPADAAHARWWCRSGPGLPSCRRHRPPPPTSVGKAGPFRLTRVV